MVTTDTKFDIRATAATIRLEAQSALNGLIELKGKEFAKAVKRARSLVRAADALDKVADTETQTTAKPKKK